MRDNLIYGDRIDVKKEKYIEDSEKEDGIVKTETTWTSTMFVRMDPKGNPVVMYDDGKMQVLHPGQWKRGFKQDAHQ